MIDSKENVENPEKMDARAVEQSVAPALQDCPPEPQKEMSKGEKAFNWTVYQGLNYWVNLISSVAIADYFRNPASLGRKHIDSAIEKATVAISKVSGSAMKSVYGQTKTV